MRATVTGGDRMEKVLKELAELRMSVKAGVPAGATTTDGQSIVEYAVYNELGTSHIPARPFLRQTIAEHQDEWASLLAAQLAGKEITREDAAAGLGLLGEVMVAHIKRTIQQGSFEPDSPKTVEKKRREGKREPDHPLIDTGQLLESIISEVTNE